MECPDLCLIHCHEKRQHDCFVEQTSVQDMHRGHSVQLRDAGGSHQKAQPLCQGNQLQHIE